ncbi:MAG: sulfurtransferase complex subunit TusB [Gammaproteobacteria bacterium]|jgi:tRNA 2-thiouridine synthesizing protein B
MTMLHIVNKSPFEKTTLDSCLRYAQEGSAVLLIEDGVYAALRGTSVSERMRDALEAIKVYVLEPDLKTRGMDQSKLLDGVELVDYGGFVDLTVAHDIVQSWL